MFRATKNWGPRISLTPRQVASVERECREAGLTCHIDQCDTGSVYVAIDLPCWERDIEDGWYNDLDCGCGDGVAKIRLSGHGEGVRQDSTHSAVGTKSECMTALRGWLAAIIAEHGPRGRAVLSAGPANQ